MRLPTPPRAPSRIKTRHLQLLAQLQREGSVLRASEALGMSQPAASKLLRELEDDMGVALFERHARGVVPTPYGEILTRRACAALAEIGRARDEVDALRRGGRVRISIGTVMSPCSEFLPAALSRLAQVEPDVLIDVDVGTSRWLVDGLLDGRLDIVIGRVHDPARMSDLLFEPLADEQLSIVARVGHPLARKRRLRLADLIDQSWVLPPTGSVVRERLDAAFLQQGLPLPHGVVETLSMPLITNLVRLSDRLVALPEDVARPFCEAGMLGVLSTGLALRMDVFGLITRRDRPKSPQLQRVLVVLREAAASTYGRTG